MKSSPDPVLVLMYLVSLAKRKKQPDRVYSYEDLKKHPEALTISIKHLFK